MYKTILSAIFMALMVLSPLQAGEAVIEVKNNSDLNRTNETIEVPWSGLKKVKGLAPENVVVTDNNGLQVPSQVIFDRDSLPCSLIFQVSADAGQKLKFRVGTGVREEYPVKAYGRYVPERLDDYAWESNKIAYRVYGKALETAGRLSLITPGIDVWVKCADNLVIDKWYKKKHYHTNQGEGMDCYRVGKTLGGGSCAPYEDGKLWFMDHNYAEYKTLANGPVRTSFELKYTAFDMNGKMVTLKKIISLDANKWFNRTDVILEGDFEKIPLAAGFVRHNVKETATGEDWFAFREEVSDSKNPARDGDIFTAVYMKDSEVMADTLSHSLTVGNAYNGETITYYSGAGWTQGGIEDMDRWIEEIKRTIDAAEKPLKIKIRQR